MGTTIKDLIHQICTDYNISESAAYKLLESHLILLGITQRDLRVWALWEDGLSQKKIAKRLSVSQSTVSVTLAKLKERQFPVSEHKDIPPLGKMLVLDEVDETTITEKF